MRSRHPVIAILCSDLHLSLRAPIARSGEEDWLEAQRRALDEISELAREHSAAVICAGDIFDHWKQNPELINFALNHLPYDMFAIPGQHDLPLHRMDLLHKSPFQTMVQAGRVNLLKPEESTTISYKGNLPHLVMYGFPWGVPITPPARRHPGCMVMAVVHQYVWIAGTEYPGAPKEQNLMNKLGDLEKYDVAVFGDNHKGFTARNGETRIINCGTFMRRKSDEEKYKPMVGLLRADGTVDVHYLNTSQDILTPTEGRDRPDDDMDIKDLVEELSKLQSTALDFKEAMLQAMDRKGIKDPTRGIIVEAMDNG